MSTLTTRGASACLRRCFLALVPLLGACAGTAMNTVSGTTDLIDTARPVVLTADKVIEVGAGPERLIELRAADGSRWLRPDDVDRYTCDVGALTCQSAVGRLATRLCRCMEQ